MFKNNRDNFCTNFSKMDSELIDLVGTLLGLCGEMSHELWKIKKYRNEETYDFEVYRENLM